MFNRFGALGRVFSAMAVVIGLAGCAASPPPPVIADRQRDELRLALPGLADHARLSAAAYISTTQERDCPRMPAGPPGVSCHVAPVPRAGRDHRAVYLLDRRGPAQIVAVRGTANWGDVWTDLDTQRVTDDQLGVEVHPGFRRIALAILEDLQTHRRLDPSKPVIVTGHSLGGAAAVLLGSYMMLAQPAPIPVQAVHTFGQPKVFSNEGVGLLDLLSDRIVRVVNCGDPVAIIPVTESRTGNAISVDFGTNRRLTDYQHLGRVLLLMPGGHFWMMRRGDLERVLPGLAGRTAADAATDRDHEHGIVRYIERLAELSDPARAIPFQPEGTGPCEVPGTQLAGR